MRVEPGSHANRPYPPPRSPWMLAMRWESLLFMHWPVRAEALRPHVPGGLQIEEFDGTAWLGVVPFRMSGTRLRFTPAIPGMSAFPELNVRTYVNGPGPRENPADRRPGVYFFSLDAANPVAVAGARFAFGLRYMRARMRCDPGPNGWIGYTSRRTHANEPAADFGARYRPTGPPAIAPPGTLASFLTDRYCLYSRHRPGSPLLRLEIHHSPWPLQPAEAVVGTNTMASPLGIEPGAIEAAQPGRWPLLHYADHMDVIAWPARRVVRSA